MSWVIAVIVVVVVILVVLLPRGIIIKWMEYSKAKFTGNVRLI